MLVDLIDEPRHGIVPDLYGSGETVGADVAPELNATPAHICFQVPPALD
jgi:hypothetical protein